MDGQERTQQWKERKLIKNRRTAGILRDRSGSFKKIMSIGSTLLVTLDFILLAANQKSGLCLHGNPLSSYDGEKGRKGEIEFGPQAQDICLYSFWYHSFQKSYQTIGKDALHKTEIQKCHFFGTRFDDTSKCSCQIVYGGMLSPWIQFHTSFFCFVAGVLMR